MYIHIQQFDAAKTLLNKGFEKSKILNYKKGQLEASKKLLLNELKRNNDTLALKWLKQYTLFTDSLYNRKTQELEQRFEKEY